MQGLNSVNQYLQNQTISPNASRKVDNFTGQSKRKDKSRDKLSISMPFSPLKGTENLGPRSSKNTRYETIDGTENEAERRNLIK